MDKKAQGATEYLIILAIVIIIALIVVGAMGGIPGIGAGARSRASASYWQTADIAIPSYAVSAGDSTLNATIRNNMRNSITITDLDIGDVDIDSNCATTSLSSGQSTVCSGTISCASAGDAYSYDVSVTYTDDETGASYTYTGEGHKLDGKCAT